ncbi:MAG: pentapeptide repeat-containing protein [Pseudomonadota bacterium]
MSDNEPGKQTKCDNPFDGAQLQGGKFTAADMRNTTFDGVNLANAKFFAVLSGAVFDDCNLSDATFKNVNLSNSSFDDVNLSNSKFHNLNLSATTFDFLNMRDVQVTRADITGMKIDGIPVSDFIAAYDEKHSLTPENDGVLDRGPKVETNPES